MKFLKLLPFLLIALLAACGEDRSGEQPFAPTVQTGIYTLVGDSVQLQGAVTASPNSRLLECGFVYGNDTLKSKVVADTLTTFSAYTTPLEPGTYYYAAYARNGVGTTNGDTLYFTIE